MGQGTLADKKRREKAVDRTLARYLDPAFWRVRDRKHRWIRELHETEPTVRMELVRAGLPAQAVVSLAEALDMSRERLTRELDIPRTTVTRKLKTGGRLGVAESERVLGVARLIGQVQQIVEESGDPEGFDAARWVAEWLERPLPALDGRPPIEFMDTAEGRDVVFGLVARMQSGAYA